MSSDPDPALERARRRRADALVGDLLPRTSGDERDDDPAADDGRDAELRRDVPPHHGG